MRTVNWPVMCQSSAFILLRISFKNKGCCAFWIIQAIKDYLGATLSPNKRLKAIEEAYKAQCRGSLIVDVAGIRLLGKMVDQVSVSSSLPSAITYQKRIETAK